jgi:hypothetical protein
MSKETNNGGIGIFTLMFLILFTAKVFGAIDWSWWWVFSPVWVPVAIILVVGLILLIFRGIKNFLND